MTSLGSKHIILNKNENEDWLKELVENKLKDVKKKTLIGCFSKVNDSILMWAHYADSFSGVCIEYEVENKSFKEVTYSDKVPILKECDGIQYGFAGKLLRSIKSDELGADKMFDYYFVKSKEWEYEQEVRVVYYLNNLEDNVQISVDLSHYFLPMPMPKRIFIGPKVQENDEFFDFIERANRRGIEIIFMKESLKDFKIIPDANRTTDILRKTSEREDNHNLLLLIKEMERSLQSNNCLGALVLSFSIVSLCGIASYSNDDPKNAFVKWFQEHIGQYEKESKDINERMPYLSGELFWEIKERVQNYGDSDVEKNLTDFRIDGVIFIFESYKPFSIFIKNSYSRLDENYERKYFIEINIQEVCSKIKSAAMIFYKNNKEILNKCVPMNIKYKDKEIDDFKEMVVANDDFYK